MPNADTTTDLTRGIYRRVYSGWIRSHRMNNVSTGAELAFLRMILLADDFGNLPASPETLRLDLFPLRRVTTAQMGGWLRELSDAKRADGTPAPLISTYRVNGELYIHIEEFEERQPAGKNGRRVQRHPVNPGESKAIQKNPVQSGPPHSEDHSEDHSDTQTHHQHQHGVAGGGGVVFCLTGEEEAYAKIAFRRPEWLKDGHGWFSHALMRSLVGKYGMTKVSGMIREAKGKRSELKNPSGYVLAKLQERAAEAAMNGSVTNPGL